MREILFRGKSISNKEWKYGGYTHANDLGDSKKYHFIVGGEEETYYGACDFSNCNAVIPDTISQYTGLADKNGKKIFEGDIVREYDNNAIIEWDANTCEYMSQHTNGLRLMFTEGHAKLDMEVIGNKWDNPELLESVK